jgi:hypothetical protein
VLDRNVVSIRKGLLALSVLLLAATPALAYVGPGAGLELVGYFMSLAVWVGIALSAFLLWPFYALVRLIRGGKAPVKNQLPPESTTEGPSDGSPPVG